MTSLIVWCVGLGLVVLLTVVLAEAGYGFDEKRGRVLKRGKGKQYDHLSEVVIEIVILVHMVIILITFVLCEQQLFEQMISAFPKTWFILFPIYGCAYATILCLICLLTFGTIKKSKHRRMIARKIHFKKDYSAA